MLDYNKNKKMNAKLITTMKAVFIKLQCQEIIIMMEAPQLLLIINAVSMENP